jgi:hypothetical protein
MRVSNEDRADLQMMFCDDLQNALHFVPGINHDGFACHRVAHDVAITLQQANAQDFVNQFPAALIAVRPFWFSAQWLPFQSSL